MTTTAIYDLSISYIEDCVNHRKMLNGFYCGDNDLTPYFQDLVLMDKDLVKFMVVDNIRKRIVGCATFCCSIIGSKHINFERFIPAIQIKHYSIDTYYQKKSMYGDNKYPYISSVIFNTFIEFLNNCITANMIGAKYLVVYSTPASVEFYRRHGFREFDKDTMFCDNGTYCRNCIPMYLEVYHNY